MFPAARKSNCRETMRVRIVPVERLRVLVLLAQGLRYYCLGGHADLYFPGRESRTMIVNIDPETTTNRYYLAPYSPVPRIHSLTSNKYARRTTRSKYRGEQRSLDESKYSNVKNPTRILFRYPRQVRKKLVHNFL